MEDALKEIYNIQQGEASVEAESLAEALGISVETAKGLMGVLVASGWAEGDVSVGIRLTMQGRERAQELIRAHRLWERYLVDREGMPLEVIHAEANIREHEMTPDEVAKLDADLGHPAWDPHGDIIPDAGCRVPPPAGSPLTDCMPGDRLRILHVEDEPPALFAQLVAMGFGPGVEVEMVEHQPRYLTVRVAGSPLILATAAAERIHAVPVPVLPVPLGELPVGVRARVVEVKGGGKHQRRMLDMGLVPGAEVTVLRKAPLGDPTEYRVKGTAVALRRSDADTILVEEITNG
ncbi:MAG TPA: metal-dependent transcriptional regulator [Candidatus Cloacimonadota bacterium]|nr:metal-dependent transcriptional regulator [Methanoregulaceae archaeon]HQP18664.1 metal-dependent transcriptional regulator [Candidatus Cloacimonadota bacterium]